MNNRVLLLLLLPVQLFGQGAPPGDAILKPTFMTGFDSFSGGTAFVCRVDELDTTLILTAHHLFGPACGWEQEFRWNELRSQFEAMTGLSMANPRRWLTSTELLEIPDAEGVNERGYDKDVAAWRFPVGCDLPSLTMADTLPKVGDKVFLFGRERGSESLALLEATVTKSTMTEFEFRFSASRELMLGGTSGAPVLNSEGNVVAINIGALEKRSALIGFGNPAPAVIKMLKGALNKQGS